MAGELVESEDGTEGIALDVGCVQTGDGLNYTGGKFHEGNGKYFPNTSHERIMSFLGLYFCSLMELIDRCFDLTLMFFVWS